MQPEKEQSFRDPFDFSSESDSSDDGIFSPSTPVNAESPPSDEMPPIWHCSYKIHNSTIPPCPMMPIDPGLEFVDAITKAFARRGREVKGFRRDWPYNH